MKLLLREQEVGGSNPLAPTKKTKGWLRPAFFLRTGLPANYKFIDGGIDNAQTGAARGSELDL